MRNPRILTWKSLRPRYSMLPSSSQRPRSPVLYMRAPAVPANGSAMKRSRFNSGRFRYPRATAMPVRDVDRGLGGAIEIVQLDAGEAREKAALQGIRQRFAAA